MNKQEKTQLARMLTFYTVDTYRYDPDQDCIFWNWKPIEIREALTQCLRVVSPSQGLNAMYTRITEAYELYTDLITRDLTITPTVERSLDMIKRAQSAIWSDKAVLITSTEWLRKQLDSEDQKARERTEASVIAARG